MTGLPVLSTDLFPAPTAVQLTEAMVGDSMQKAYTNGASPTLMVVPLRAEDNGQRLLADRRLRFYRAEKPRLCQTVDVIATDFVSIKVIRRRWLPPDVGLIIDPDYLVPAFFRSFRQYLMARTGDAETRMIIVEFGVEVRNALASILFNGITK